MYRYIGNKTAILDPLLEIICRDANQDSIFADPMCGTASVSSALVSKGYKVVAGDILTFPTYHALVRLTMPESPKFQGIGLSYQEILSYLNLLDGFEGFITKEYSDGGVPENGSPARKYLTKENAMWVDTVTAVLNEWVESEKISVEENSLLRHDLLMAVNRVANIAGTYGHYRSTFSNASSKKIELHESIFNFWASKANSVLFGPSEKLVPNIKADYLYLDPPYKKRQYAANYHLLETIALGDFPEPTGLSGLRDWWPNYSDFCSKRKIAGAFAATLENHAFKKVFVSYSEDGLIPEGQMLGILSDFGTVKVHKFTHKRFKSNASNLSNDFSEFVFEVTQK
jgi:adenine-specific DNA-methyltransferase